MRPGRAALLAGLFVAVLATSLVAAQLAIGVWGFLVDGRIGLFSPVQLGVFLREALDFADHGFEHESVVLAAAVLHAAAIVLLLAPVVPRPQGSFETRSLWGSVIGACVIGGFAAMLILASLVEAAVALVNVVRDSPKGVVEFGDLSIEPTILFGTWILAGAGWAVYLARLGGLRPERHPSSIDRLFRRAFAATALEAVLAVPIYLLLRRRSGCECALASFFGLVAGVAALASLCGPWAFLFLTRRVRRNWMRAACPGCGYPRRTGGRVCSECGQAFPAGAGASAPG